MLRVCSTLFFTLSIFSVTLTGLGTLQLPKPESQARSRLLFKHYSFLEGWVQEPSLTPHKNGRVFHLLGPWSCWQKHQKISPDYSSAKEVHELYHRLKSKTKGQKLPAFRVQTFFHSNKKSKNSARSTNNSRY